MSHSFRPLLASAVAALLAGAIGVSPVLASTSPAVLAGVWGSSSVLPYRDPALPTAQRVADLLSRMTLQEKVGQMTQAERGDVDADRGLITAYGLGSLLSGGGSTPATNVPAAWANMVDDYQSAALKTRLGIPLLYGIDAVHGNNNVVGATIFPHNIGLGASRDSALVEQVAHVTATETRATGPNWAFAACVCVARDDRWGRTYESFGESPDLVSKMTVAFRGLQGGPGQLDEPDRILATAKHFAGDGLTTYGTGSGGYPIDQGVDEVSRADFKRLALAPYRPAVQMFGVGAVMPSYSSVDWTDDGLGNPVKMSGNKELLTGVLKGSLGFAGITVSDWRAIHQLPGDYPHQVKTSVNAGMDMFMEPYSGDTVGWKEFIATLTGLVRTGEVPIARINDAVTRILTQKMLLGLFEKAYTDRTNLAAVGRPKHRALARRAVAESQVLLRNTARTLPLSAVRPVYVAGSNADDIGNQSGGWTVSWQGQSGAAIPGDTILGGIRAAASGRVVYSKDASAPVPTGASGVVVVGETPYAEGFGDVGGPSFGGAQPQTMQLSAADKQAVRTVCAAAATCTVLTVSGRPVIIPPDLLGQIDALVASWLPGSEGRGVADVLFGAAPFIGKLPVSWPKSVAQEPINVGDAHYDPLFAYGFGLRA